MIATNPYTERFRADLKRIALRENPQWILELGVGTGSTHAFLSTGIPVVSVDIRRPRIINGIELYEETGNPHWSMYVEDDMDFVKRLKDNSIPFLFLDTSHMYPHTLDELRAYYPKMCGGALIVMHDRSWEGVERAIKEFTDEMGLEFSVEDAHDVASIRVK